MPPIWKVHAYPGHAGLGSPKMGVAASVQVACPEKPTDDPESNAHFGKIKRRSESWHFR